MTKIGTVLVLTLLITSTGVSASSSCLTDAHKQQIQQINNDTGGNLESVFQSMCTRDNTFRTLIRDDVEQELEKMKEWSNVTINDATDQILKDVQEKLDRQDKVAHALDRLATVNNQSYKYNKRIETLESENKELRNRLDTLNESINQRMSEEYVTEQEYQVDQEQQTLEMKNYTRTKVVSNRGITSNMTASPTPGALALLLILGFLSYIGYTYRDFLIEKIKGSADSGTDTPPAPQDGDEVTEQIAEALEEDEEPDQDDDEEGSK